MAGRLDRKAALITGGGSGLGKAGSVRFAEEGARVLVADLNGQAAEAVASAISDMGHTASGITTDFSSEESTAAMAATALDRYGTTDAIYSNADIVGIGNAMDLDKRDWHRVIAVMLTGV